MQMVPVGRRNRIGIGVESADPSKGHRSALFLSGAVLVIRNGVSSLSKPAAVRDIQAIQLSQYPNHEQHAVVQDPGCARVFPPQSFVLGVAVAQRRQRQTALQCFNW